MQKIQYIIKSIGTKKIILKDLFLNIDFTKISLENFIKEIVFHEVNYYNEKLKKTQNDQNFEFDFLIGNGKYSFGNIYNDKIIDIEKSKEIAILGFKDGLFSIFYGDYEIKNLDDVINLEENKEFTFVKLTFLSGGYF